MDLFQLSVALVTLAASFAFINYQYLRLPTTIGVTLLAILFSMVLVGLVAFQMLRRIDNYQTEILVSLAIDAGGYAAVRALLRADADTYARLITQDMGKRISESQYEIEYCANIAEYYAKGAERFLADQSMDVEDADAYLRFEPLGVLLGVMPWNFPFYQVVRFAAPNIMAGNTVMVKHASNVPQCAKAIEDLFAECGLPEGVYTNLFISSEFVEATLPRPSSLRPHWASVEPL